MAALPAQLEHSKTVDAIHASTVAASIVRHAPQLTTSIIGHECTRFLWYTFRWAVMPDGTPRVLRKIHSGKIENARFVVELRIAGCQVYDEAPALEFTAVGGHLLAKLGAVAENVPEAPKTPHVVITEALNESEFLEVKPNGVSATPRMQAEMERKFGSVEGLAARPMRSDQAQAEMEMAGLERTLYLAVNKNTDELYSERIRRDSAKGKALLQRAKLVVLSKEPPEKCDGCGVCVYEGVCKGTQLPDVTCRSCCHATPEIKDGERVNLWKCEKHGRYLVRDDQEKACADHLYIPSLIGGAEVMDGGQDAQGDWVMYRKPDGTTFVNSRQPGAYTSTELRMAPWALVGAGTIQRLKETVGAVITEVEPLEEGAARKKWVAEQVNINTNRYEIKEGI